MVDSTMVVGVDWLRKQLEVASPDLLGEIVGGFIAALMGAEADAICGAAYREVSPERVTSRNGYRHRDFDTRVGTRDVAIPKLRSESYYPDWLLQPRRRAEKALISVVATCYLLGVSTRRVEKLVQTLGIAKMSKSQVSELAKSERSDAGQPRGAPRGLGLDRMPQGVPVHPQMPGQRRDGGVIVGQRIGRPPDCPAGQHRPRRDQLVLLRPGLDRAGGLGAAPDPFQPDQQHRDAEARRVRGPHAAPAVPGGHHPTARAAGHIGVGLDRDHQLVVPSAHVEHMHPVAVEHRIGPDAPARVQTTPIVIHVGVFSGRPASSLPILKTPTPNPQPPAPPRRRRHPRSDPKSP